MADELLNIFATMGTTDHGTLIEQFVSVIPDCQPEMAHFFLEANSWNLQAAIAGYMDYGGSAGEAVAAFTQMPSMEFVCDITIGEGEEITPASTFQKTWRIRNNGSIDFPPGTVLMRTRGDALGAPEWVNIPPLSPGEIYDITVSMQSPAEMGSYSSSWRLSFAHHGSPTMFGDEIWVVITVAQGGALGLTQALFATSFQRQDQQFEQQPHHQDDGDEAVAGLLAQTDLNQAPPQQPSVFGSSVFGTAAPTMHLSPSPRLSFGSLQQHRFGATFNNQQPPPSL